MPANAASAAARCYMPAPESSDPTTPIPLFVFPTALPTPYFVPSAIPSAAAPRRAPSLTQPPALPARCRDALSTAVSRPFCAAEGMVRLGFHLTRIAGLCVAQRGSSTSNASRCLHSFGTCTRLSFSRERCRRCPPGMEWRIDDCLCSPGRAYSTTLALLWTFNGQTNSGARITNTHSFRF